MDERLVSMMCGMVEGGVPVYSAGNAVGFTKRMVDDMMRIGMDDAYAGKDTVFSRCYAMIIKAKGKAITELVGKIKEAGEKDWKANSYLLERLEPSVFSQSALSEKGSEDDGGITVIADVPNPELPNGDIKQLDNKELDIEEEEADIAVPSSTMVAS